MLMRYHWGLGVGHVGMGAFHSIEDSAPGQIISGDEGNESDPHILGLDQDIHGTTPRHAEEHNTVEGNSEGEDSSTNSLSSHDNDSDESDSGSEDPRQDRRKLDLHNMYGVKEKNQTSYD